MCTITLHYQTQQANATHLYVLLPLYISKLFKTFRQQNNRQNNYPSVLDKWLGAQNTIQLQMDRKPH